MYMHIYIYNIITNDQYPAVFRPKYPMLCNYNFCLLIKQIIDTYVFPIINSFFISFLFFLFDIKKKYTKILNNLQRNTKTNIFNTF